MAPKGFAHGSLENLEDGGIVLKLNLRLLRVDIDVQFRGIHGEIDEEGHLVALGNQTVEGRHDSLGEIGVAHVATVGEEELCTPFFLCAGGKSHKTVDGDQGSLHGNGNEEFFVALAKEVDDAAVEVLRLQVIEQTVGVVEGKGNVGVGKGDALKFLENVVEFRLIGLQELATRGDIEKEVFHHEVCPLWAHHYVTADDLRPFDMDAGATVIAREARAEFHLCHGGNRGERLATEPHRLEREEVLGGANL